MFILFDNIYVGFFLHTSLYLIVVIQLPTIDQPMSIKHVRAN